MKKKTIISYTKLSWIITALLIFTLLFDNLPKNVHADTSSTSINYESIDNENSYLKTELISDKNLSLYLNQTTSIKYKITPQPINTKLDDIVFVVDLSENMKDNSTQDNSRSRINCVEQTLQKLKGDKNINNANVFIVGYNSEWENNDSFKNYNAKFDQLSTNKDSCYSKFIDTKSALSSYAGIGKIKNPVTDNFGFYPGSSSYDDYSIKFETNLGDALKTANDYLCKINLEKHRNQSIIMFSRRASLTSTDIGSQYIKDDILCNSIKAKNYKIVTVDISKDMYLPNRDENLKKLQTSLTTVPCQEGYNYITAEPVCSGEEYQYGSFGDQLWNNIFPKLILGTSASDASCVFENVQLNFGLNNSFEVGDKATIDFGDSPNVPNELKGKVQINIEHNTNGTIAIKLPENCINYIKDASDDTFKANIFKISFDVTPKVNGNDLQFGRDATGNLISNLTYTQNIAGEESSKTVVVPTPSITVSDLNPQIGTPALVSPNPNPTTANIGDSINVKYNFAIYPGTAVYSKIQPSQINEVLFLVDVSKNMKTQARTTYFQNGICKQILNRAELKANNLKVGIIGIKEGDPMLVRGTNEAQKYNGKDLSNVNLLNINESSDINDIVQQRAKQTESIINNSTWDTPNVMGALTKADDILQAENGNNKAIVLIVSQDFQYDESKLTALKNRGYKIIIMDISYNGTKNVAQENLNKLYNFLNGYGDNCMLGKYGSQTDTNYNSADYDFNKIELALSNGMNDKSYKLKNLKFNFDLGEGFYPVNNSTSISYSTTINNIMGSNFQGETSLGNNRYSLTIPDIDFKCEIVENPCKDDSSKIKVKYTPNINNQPVDGGNFSVNFNVRFVKFTLDNPVVFGTKDTAHDNNYVSYNDIKGNLVSPIYIGTPAVKGTINIVHGIYWGKVDGKQKIDDTNTNNTFPKSAYVPMAAKFEISTETKLQLTIGSGLIEKGIPKIYKVLDSGDLQLLGEMNSNNYTVQQGDIGNIIVIYSVELPKENSGQYKNTITVGNVPKDAVINAGTNDLPDLF